MIVTRVQDRIVKLVNELSSQSFTCPNVSGRGTKARIVGHGKRLAIREFSGFELFYHSND